MLVSSGDSIKLWDSQTYEQLQEIPLVQKAGSALSWNNDGRFLASVNKEEDGISLYAVSGLSAICVDVLKIGSHQNCLEFARKSPRFLALGGQDGQLPVWDIKTKMKKKSFMIQNASISKLSFNYSDSHIVAGTMDGEACFVSNAYNKVLGRTRLFPKGQAVMDIQFSTLCNTLIGASGMNGSVVLLDSHSCRIIKSFPQAHTAPASSVAFSPINNYLFLSTGYDRKLISYDILEKREVLTHLSPSPLSCVTFFENGQHIALGTIVGDIIIHDFRKLNTPMKIISAHDGSVSALKFQPPVLEVKTSRKSSSVTKTSDTSLKTTGSLPEKVPLQNMENVNVKHFSPSLEILSPVRMNSNQESLKVRPSDLGRYSPAITPKSLSLDASMILLSPPRKNAKDFSSSSIVNPDYESPSKAKPNPHSFVEIEVSIPLPNLKPSDREKHSFIDELLSPVRNNIPILSSPRNHDSPIGFTSRNHDSPMEITSRNHETPMETTSRNHEGPMEFTPINHESPMETTSRTNDSPMGFSPRNDEYVESTISAKILNSPMVQDRIVSLGDSFPNVHITDRNITANKLQQDSFHKANEDHFLRKSLENDSLLDIIKLNCEAMSKKQKCLDDLEHLKSQKPVVYSEDEELGEMKGNNVNLELIQRCVEDALESHEFKVNKRFMHLHYTMIKHFLHLKNEIHQLFKDNSINEDLLLENERLREELAKLKLTY